MSRKPMTFDIDRSPSTVAELGGSLKGNGEETVLKQVGARVSAEVYKRLKSRAALEGNSVQSLVEKAIVSFLENGN